MERLIRPGRIDRQVSVPASKSYAQRAILAAFLSRGRTLLRHLTSSEDVSHALALIESWGAVVEPEPIVMKPEETNVDSERFFEKNGGVDCRVISEGLTSGSRWGGGKLPATLFCGESGLLARMVLPIAALLSEPVRVTGSGTLLKRPMEMAEVPLRQLGAQITTTAGTLPALVQGPLRGGYVALDGSITSQLLTGLLMALPLLREDSVVEVKNLSSKPYIDMTLELLAAFGIRIVHDNYSVFHVQGNQYYHPTTYMIEGDWSAAATLLVAGCLTGGVTLSNLNPHSLQADRHILDIVQKCGADLIWDKKAGVLSLSLADDRTLTPFMADATDCPDLIPALTALASACPGVSRITGLHRLQYKESNRGVALQEEFARLGIAVALAGDEIAVTGGKINGGTVSSHQDHRIAMALAIAALRADAPVVIQDAQAVSKSYPGFWELFGNL